MPTKRKSLPSTLTQSKKACVAPPLGPNYLEGLPDELIYLACAQFSKFKDLYNFGRTSKRHFAVAKAYFVANKTRYPFQCDGCDTYGFHSPCTFVSCQYWQKNCGFILQDLHCSLCKPSNIPTLCNNCVHTLCLGNMLVRAGFKKRFPQCPHRKTFAAEAATDPKIRATIQKSLIAHVRSYEMPDGYGGFTEFLERCEPYVQTHDVMSLLVADCSNPSCHEKCHSTMYNPLAMDRVLNMF
jgi:hypothetical protein